MSSLQICTNELNDHLFRSAVLRSQEYNHSDIDFHCNLERTLHRFDTENLSMVSVNKMLVNLLKIREGKRRKKEKLKID